MRRVAGRRKPAHRLVKAVYRPRECSLTISGHAGYAEPGSDIVCAGVSAIVGAAWAALREHPGFIFEDDGDELCIGLDTAEDDYGRTVISMAAGGIELIAVNYPHFVDFIRKQGGKT